MTGILSVMTVKLNKPGFLIEDKFEDREWISELIRITAEELPVLKKKRK